MTRILFTVTLTIAGDVSTVAVYGYAVVDLMGGMVRDEDWDMVGEEKR